MCYLIRGWRISLTLPLKYFFRCAVAPVSSTGAVHFGAVHRVQGIGVKVLLKEIIKICIHDDNWGDISWFF